MKFIATCYKEFEGCIQYKEIKLESFDVIAARIKLRTMKPPGFEIKSIVEE